jgi:hypothetical protein
VQTGYLAELLDAEGRVISQDVLYAYPFEGAMTKSEGDCGCSGTEPPQPLRFKAMLNDVAPGTSLRIVKRGKVLWERRAPQRVPALKSVSASLDKKGNLELRWNPDAESKDVEVWARWSDDDGRTWHALTIARKGEPLKVASDQLPSGKVRFQILVHDGFHTVSAVTEVLNIPAKPSSLAILYPGPSARVYADRQMHLAGVASTHTGAAIPAERAAWYIDDKAVATGFDAWVDNPGAGRHKLRLEVREGDLVATAATDFNVIPEEAQDIG